MALPLEQHERIEAYIQDLFLAEDDALRQARERAKAAGMPSIHVPAALGALLAVLVRGNGARKILEIGILGGYSGIWMARALPPDGRVISLELSPTHADIARDSFQRAGVGNRVDVRVGAALETLPTLTAEAPFDLVFIDADKDNYPAYLDWAIKLSRPGTVIVGDNVLRGGTIIDPASDDAGAQGIHEFNRRAATHPRLDAVILPNRDGRDGVLIAAVKGESL